MGAKQSTNQLSTTSPSRAVLQSNGSSSGHHNHSAMASTSVSGGGRSNSTRLTATNGQTSHNSNQTNSDIQTSSDWRQRARSLSSVLNGSQTNGNAIHVPQIHSSFGLSASPDSDTSTDDNLSFGRVFSAHSLPVQLISFNGIKCPVCSKFVLPDDVECHLVMCLTKPRINYNEDMLTEDKGECVICLEELIKGNTIARLPCLCIYHKSCIDAWFEVNRSCPEHPSD